MGRPSTKTWTNGCVRKLREGDSLLCSPIFPLSQIEKQFNDLLDSCGAFRTAIGASADIVSLGRAMEQLSSEHGIGTASTAERALLDWHMANLECVESRVRPRHCVSN